MDKIGKRQQGNGTLKGKKKGEKGWYLRKYTMSYFFLGSELFLSVNEEI